MRTIIVLPNSHFEITRTAEVIPNSGDIVEIEGLQFVVRKRVFDYTAKEIRIFVS